MIKGESMVTFEYEPETFIGQEAQSGARIYAPTQLGILPFNNEIKFKKTPAKP